MNRKLLPTLCCALLCAFAGLFLSSCVSADVKFAYGPASMQRGQVCETTNKVYKQKPATLQQMCDILGAQPQAEYADAKGKYCAWRSCEDLELHGFMKGTASQAAYAVCLINNNGDIEKYLFLFCPRPYEWGGYDMGTYALGDKELEDYKLHPGAEKVWLEVFREQELRRGISRRQEVVFSPSGRTSHFLVPGSYVKEWVGETPNVGYTIPQGQQPLVQSQPQLEPQQPLPPQTPAPQQQSSSKSLIDTANTAIKLINLFR